MNKLFLLFLLLSLQNISKGQKYISKKVVDSLMVLYDRIDDKKVVVDTAQIEKWNSETGKILDTAIYTNYYESKKNVLVRLQYVDKSFGTELFYYYYQNELVAVRIISLKDFPSWKNTVHYFTSASQRKRSTMLTFVSGDESEESIRQVILLEGYSNLEAFRRRK